MYAAWTLREWATVGGLGLALLVLLAVKGYVLVGLFQSRSLIRRELAALFLSPIAYVVLVVFLVVTGFFFSETMDQLTATGPVGVEYPLQAMYSDRYFWVLFAVIPACLTMRSFAEERSSGTLELLLTAPVKEWQVVLSKFVAVYVFYLLMWLPTLAYLPILLNLSATFDGGGLNTWSIAALSGIGLVLLGLILLWPRLGTGARITSMAMIVGGLTLAVVGGVLHFRQPAPHLLDVSAGIDPSAAFTLYGGMALAGAMFLALGLFVSSLVRDQLVAALLSLALSAPFIVAAIVRIPREDGGLLDRVIYFFSVPLHFTRTFSRGLLDTRPLILYATVAAFFLFLTVRSLEGRRWR